MIEPETALIIGMICGLAFGYMLGFLVARGVYRQSTWPD
jgi:high-affinity Fe2+/Pb2+ permease